ncbi:MAG: cytochrome c oxidase accessory protein CcoG, partial [Rhodospirillaceae bacterium]|nr:cytochrome c oxidase accessory protein CcoG [Rhodospirillaceae bacterium]
MTDIYADQDALSRKEQQDSLYADRVRVYPKKIKGRVRQIKWAVLTVLLGVYYLAPWLRWDRGPAAPDQAFLIDMPHRRAYFLWIEIWPQELYFLVGL